MPTNSTEPWGLIVPGRPPTPSEGAAQTYHRVGPPGTQKTRTFGNGTCLTFGPLDPVDEFHPDLHPFREQVAEIDTAVRDCRNTRLRYEGGTLMPRGEDQESVSIRADDEFNGFRQFPERNPQNLSLARLQSGTYIQVPSRHASCQNSISYYSKANSRFQYEHSTDTRFGVITKPESAQPRQFATSGRGGRGGRHVTGGRNASNGQRQATDSGNVSTQQRLIFGGRTTPTGPRHITDSRDLLRGPPQSNSNRGTRIGESLFDVGTKTEEETDGHGHSQASRSQFERHRGRGGHVVNERSPTRGREKEGPPNIGAEIRKKYVHAEDAFNRAYQGFRFGRATQAPAADGVASRKTFKTMQSHPAAISDQPRPVTQSYGQSYQDQVRAREREAVKRLVDIGSPTSQPIPKGPSMRAAQSPLAQYHPAPIETPRSSRPPHRRARTRKQGGDSGAYYNRDDTRTGQAIRNHHGTRARRGGFQPEHGYFQHSMRSAVQPQERAFHHHHSTRTRRSGGRRHHGQLHGDIHAAFRSGGLEFNRAHDSGMVAVGASGEGLYFQDQDDIRLASRILPRPKEPFNDSYGRDPMSYPMNRTQAPAGYGADGLQDFTGKDPRSYPVDYIQVTAEDGLQDFTGPDQIRRHGFSMAPSGIQRMAESRAVKSTQFGHESLEPMLESHFNRSAFSMSPAAEMPRVRAPGPSQMTLPVRPASTRDVTVPAGPSTTRSSPRNPEGRISRFAGFWKDPKYQEKNGGEEKLVGQMEVLKFGC